MAKQLGKRLRSWARTLTKLALLVLGYFWLGAAYKLFYAQTHDLTRFKGQLPLSFYQQQFILESLLRQTWMFGPDFREYIGTPPSVRALTSTNPQAVLADYCRQREQELSALPTRYPRSLFNENALEDAFLMSQGAAFLGTATAREKPVRGLAIQADNGSWRTVGLPELYRSAGLARRLADEYPASAQAPTALLRVAQMEEQQGHTTQSRTLYQRITLEYPQSPEAEDAANALATAAYTSGHLRQSRDLKQHALEVAEQTAREKFPGQPLPASTAFKVLGYHLDLSEVNLQLQQLKQVQDSLALANRETQRLKTLPSLEQRLKEDLSSAQHRLQRVHDEAWVATLFQDLKVGVPGPPPRPHEYSATGRVLVDNQPFPGVEVVLSDSHNNDFNPGSLVGIAGSHYRAVSDAQGYYRITGVPAGIYWINAIYPLHSAPLGNAVVTPISNPAIKTTRAMPQLNSSLGGITITNKPVSLPVLRFQQALTTNSFGELPPTGYAVPLSWQPWPGAAAYRVEVLAAANNVFFFNLRVPRAKRAVFVQHPVLWQSAKTSALQVACPLLPLAPDRPQGVRFAQYEYVVTALDNKDKPIATSAIPLSRFVLSPEACVALLKLKPHVYRERLNPKGFWGRRRR
ncbi:MAG: hypothetical protein JO316_09685 [Abitibacteriaceae bacterium]|nr:hypothetical protein [Abditibacteriaceae bacterium]